MSKIKFKLTGAQYATITALIRDTDVNMIHQQVTSLINDLMMEILEATFKRSLILDLKSSLSLSSAQARAFMMYFSYVELLDAYEQNLIRTMINHIHQELANNNKKLTSNRYKTIEK